ncbi:MAG: NADH ubiquinone oxidoreductase [Rhodobacteraceae bacterium]|nr:MAG: NADH ubiquinone oxidoreductase [Paracoccaceae bacterium]
MRILTVLAVSVALGLGTAPGQLAGETPIEDFSMSSDTGWRFFSDGVMGGVSTGQFAILRENGQAFARMTGRVSTANNGGFIQMRLDLPTPPPDGTAGVRLVVRGNDQRYFVHLRTSGTVLPWQYYQAPFEVTGDWREVRIPLERFAASGALLRRVPRPGSLRSVAVVAFGRDHEAEIDVREIAFY